MTGDIDLAIDMAHAIQRFRNLPQKLMPTKMRGTREYSRLCLAWEEFVERYPSARLTQETMKP